MIYILTEQILNGTVTIDTIITLIESDSFEGAYEKLKGLTGWPLAQNIKVDDTGVEYTIHGDFPCWGKLKREPAVIL